MGIWISGLGATYFCYLAIITLVKTQDNRKALRLIDQTCTLARFKELNYSQVLECAPS